MDADLAAELPPDRSGQQAPLTPVLRGVLRQEVAARAELEREIGPFMAEYHSRERVTVRVRPEQWRRVIAMYRRPNRSHPPPKEIVIGFDEGLVTLMEGT